MKTGIIIVFRSKKKDLIPKERLIALFNRGSSIKFCLLNKNNDEFVLDYLAQIADQCDNVSVVNIRNNQMNISAVRAGARFMHNEFNLKFLGYIIESRKVDVVEFTEYFIEHEEHIVEEHIAEQRKKGVKQTFIQKLLSIPDFLKRHQLVLS